MRAWHKFRGNNDKSQRGIAGGDICNFFLKMGSRFYLDIPLFPKNSLNRKVKEPEPEFSSYARQLLRFAALIPT
ncbi:MAG: hypothetical protein AB2L16_04045 [Anaerolineaceae bacterium]